MKITIDIWSEGNAQMLTQTSAPESYKKYSRWMKEDLEYQDKKILDQKIEYVEMEIMKQTIDF